MPDESAVLGFSWDVISEDEFGVEWEITFTDSSGTVTERRYIPRQVAQDVPPEN